MNEHEKKQLAKDIVEELRKGHGCSVFDKETISGIKAIATLYNEGRRGAKTAFFGLIGLGLLVLLLVGIKHYFKDF